jgi:hypothetical protein
MWYLKIFYLMGLLHESFSMRRRLGRILLINLTENTCLFLSGNKQVLHLPAYCLASCLRRSISTSASRMKRWPSALPNHWMTLAAAPASSCAGYRAFPRAMSMTRRVAR